MARFGSRWKSWSRAEEDKLAELYGLVPDSVLAADLGRSPEAIETRARTLGLSRVENRRRQGTRVLSALNGISWWDAGVSDDGAA